MIRPTVFLIKLSNVAVEIKKAGTQSLPPDTLYFDNNEFYVKRRLGFEKIKKNNEGKIAFLFSRDLFVIASLNDV